MVLRTRGIGDVRGFPDSIWLCRVSTVLASAKGNGEITMNNKKMTPLLAAGVAATMCATLGLAGCGGDGNRTNSEGKPIIKVTLI